MRIHKHANETYTLDQYRFVKNTLKCFDPRNVYKMRQTPLPPDYIHTPKTTKHKMKPKTAKANVFPGHSVALQMLGCFLLWVGWYGFNTGAALLLENSDHRGDLASLAGVNTALSAGVGGLSALFLNMMIQERLTGEPFFDLQFAMNGTLSGAVAITGSCALIEPWAAVVIGLFSGVFFIIAHHLVLHFKIDDCVDAIAGTYMKNECHRTENLSLNSKLTLPLRKISGKLNFTYLVGKKKSGKSGS